MKGDGGKLGEATHPRISHHPHVPQNLSRLGFPIVKGEAQHTGFAEDAEER